MRFHWPLQRLLSVTEKRELALKAELFGLSRQIARSEEAIHRRRTMLQMLLADLASMPLPERVGRQDVLMRCHKTEQTAVRRLQEQVDEWTRLRTRRTSDLATLMAKKDTLQKMREDARQKYQRYLDRREQTQADEVFLMGYARHAHDRRQQQSA